MGTLPDPVLDLLGRLDAPPQLVAHLTLVHAVACTLIERLAKRWPDLPYDGEAVRVGAATHDIGKVVHRAELGGPGHAHEDDGPALLIQAGYPEALARFARTHGRWASDPGAKLEDLLVAVADTIWKGKRDEHLEGTLVQRITGLTAEEPWVVYMALDEIVQSIAQNADARLAWQAGHPA